MFTHVLSLLIQISCSDFNEDVSLVSSENFQSLVLKPQAFPNFAIACVPVEILLVSGLSTFKQSLIQTLKRIYIHFKTDGRQTIIQICTPVR